ncbi:MAG: glycosyltransferase family 4 protein [Spirochaetes bacterium]|nr:glycosyltransferase family 4 protein [Spirochaetota bacterium]
MKIVYVVPGFGGTFYCQNCFRDGAMIRLLRRGGHDVVVSPMYLPLTGAAATPGAPVFFGAINLYLQEKFPLFRRAPAWLKRFFDRPFFLRFASARAGSTRVRGLEGMTLSVLRGELGHQAAALDELVTWLKRVEKPDLVHLSNALILGLAPRIRRETGARIICSLQDEDTWVEAMEHPHDDTAWSIMAEQARHVDAFVSVSKTYGEKMRRRLSIPPKKLHVVPIGVETRGRSASALPWDPPVIGFLSRLSPTLGLDVLLDAFALVKKDPRLAAARLHLTGGLTGDDGAFLRRAKRRLSRAGILGDVSFIPDAFASDLRAFLRGLTVLSVPVPGGEAFGTYQIEAMAAGVPVVQPDAGAFPEIVKDTGGGLIYAPNDAAHLAKALTELLTDRALAGKLGRRGQESVRKKYSVEAMVKKMDFIYRSLQVRTQRGKR